MNKGNNVLICIGLLMLIYFLFSNAIIEGITTYIKGSSGTLCDGGTHIASKKECGEALKSLDLPTKEWWTGNDKEMPPYCSVSSGKDPQEAQWNESVTGKGHEGSFAICKGSEGGAMTPEEADADLSKKARVYLRGIGDELKDLGKLRNKKRRTPVNIHIDVGDAPGQEGTPSTKTRPSLGSADIPTQSGGDPQNGGQNAERCKFKMPCDPEEITNFYGKQVAEDFRKAAGRNPTEKELVGLDAFAQKKILLDLCACVEKAGKQDANCIPQDAPEGEGQPIADFYKNTCSQSQQQSYKSAEMEVPSANESQREGFALFPPTLGISHYGFTEGFLEGIGEPNKNDYGLQNQSKNNSDIRNVSEYNTRHQHSTNDQQPSRQPVSQGMIDAASLKNNHLNGQKCTEKDHRGCRWWGIDSSAEREKKKKEMEAKQYNLQLESNYKLELENWKLEEESKKEGYDKEKEIWDEQQKKLREEKEEKQESEKQRKEDYRQEIATKQQMVKDNAKFDRIEQINKLAWAELSKPDDPNDPTTLAGKANVKYEKDLLNWWEAEQLAHKAGMPADPNIKPPTLGKLTPHTSDKVASLLADLQSQDWGGTAGVAHDTKPPNKLPPNYKATTVSVHGSANGVKSSPLRPGSRMPLKPPPKDSGRPPARAGQAPAPLIGRSATQPGGAIAARQYSQPRQVPRSKPAGAGQAPPPLKQAEGTTQVDNTGSSFRGWGGGGGSKPEGQAQQLSRHGIKKIIYNRDQKISPKTQRELGLGVHDMKDTHKQVIKQVQEPRTWYEWAFGGGKARPDHSHTHIKQ